MSGRAIVIRMFDKEKLALQETISCLTEKSITLINPHTKTVRSFDGSIGDFVDTNISALIGKYKNMERGNVTAWCNADCLMNISWTFQVGGRSLINIEISRDEDDDDIYEYMAESLLHIYLKLARLDRRNIDKWSGSYYIICDGSYYDEAELEDV
ncbi:MAG: hypothetical protein IBJ18_04680 [Phycisphaerales bacterium]|nr:hypothetical protein [Phycisphaerales bacterium]